MPPPCRVLICAFALALPALADRPSTRPVADRIPNTTIDLDMVRVPGGRLTLKDADGKERVHELKPFLIQRTEHRWEQWDVFFLGLTLPEEGTKEQRHAAREKQVDAVLGPSSLLRRYEPPDNGFGRAGWPVIKMHPRAIPKYVEWLNKATGRRYRLPTAAEWEWACRAGAAGPLNPARAELEKNAWYIDNSSDRVRRCATKAPNAWGLYDMLGNVAEWVTPAGGGELILAGGSFDSEPEDVHSGAREKPNFKQLQRDDPQDPKETGWLSNGAHTGFRLVRDVGEGENE